MREDNIRLLEETLKLCKSGRKLTAVQVFLPGEVHALEPKDTAPLSGPCHFSCKNTDSFSMALGRQRELRAWDPGTRDRVLVLNFANPVHPGGGVRHGATAQEEDLCRKSSLLLSLESRGAQRYYRYNASLQTRLGSDAIIITPTVKIIRDADCSLLEQPETVAVMTCAAPMITYGLEGLTQREYEAMLRRRITGMLRCAASLGYRDLILGAFGCGAFRNDAAVVARLFREALDQLELKGMTTDQLFRQIDFAVLSRNGYNFEAFDRFFGRSAAL